MKNGREFCTRGLRRIASTTSREPVVAMTVSVESLTLGFSIKGESNRGRRFSSAVKYSRTSWGVLGLGRGG